MLNAEEGGNDMGETAAEAAPTPPGRHGVALFSFYSLTLFSIQHSSFSISSLPGPPAVPINP
jgi:hypothetical protein